ncbi:MAG: O-methyltransferase [Bacteroidales bacterium]|nr:O-methyltransferase [Bacteroidales bacterium]
MTEADYIEKYSSSHLDQVLGWLEKQTHLRTNCARMLSGKVVGGLISHLSQMIRPKAILELGVFTGYSTICLAAGLAEGGVIDALELNDELEDLIKEGYSRAGISSRVNLIFGDAKEIIPSLSREYDLVYIDANKREYLEYYNLVFDKVRSGGYILADNVLWSGKVLEDPQPADAQTAGIEAFNRAVAADNRVENLILPFRDGLNIIRKL